MRNGFQSIMFVIRKYTVFLILLSITAAVVDVEASRFPRPEFESGYETPITDFGHARAVALYYMDAAVLFIALCAASFLILKKRSRKGIFALAVFCAAYFGFYAKGCTCSIGAIQNVTASIFTGYAIPLSAALFFLLPLLFSLFFGRAFCSSVCPLGTVQEFVILKPKRLPQSIAAVLGFIPHLYLGTAILFAATGAGFIICRYDPFVGIFRFGAPLGMIIFGGTLLAVSTVIARPYCRFLCPYGVLLGLTSRLSKWNVRISPTTCINCRLCENACPVDAINSPSTEPVKEPRSRSMKRLKTYLLIFPLWIMLGAFTGWILSDSVSARHPQVKLSHSIEFGGLQSEGLRANSEVIAQLKEQSVSAKRSVKFGMILLGAYMGLIIGIYLIRQSTHKKLTEYSADSVKCIGCGRCYKYCPQGKTVELKEGQKGREGQKSPNILQK